MKGFSIYTAMLLCSAMTITAQRYVGGDISLLQENEKAGAIYKTHEGEKINDLLPWCREQGMNAMRVRVFVDPFKYVGSAAHPKDPNACQTVESVLPLCQRIKQNGMALMLDFHYSDNWADPAMQYTPADWKDLSDDELYEKIYEYTKESLEMLNAAGATPDFIQTGNEISYGMLWGPEGTSESDKKTCWMGNSANWARFGKLLQSAGKACRETCPDAKIVLHTERVAQVNVLTNFYDQMKKLDVDYDIIGLSYYPYFHGKMSVLDNALTTLESKYADKDIMIVETGYSYKWEVPGTTVNLTNTYPYSDAGQNKFATELVQTLESHKKVNGLFWWWMEYNAYNTSLSNWYNATLFDCTTGRATSALKTICSFGADASVNIPVADTECVNPRYFTLDGKVADLSHKGIVIKVSGKNTKKILR